MTDPLRRTVPAAVTALLSAALMAGCGAGNSADDGTPTTTPTTTTTTSAAMPSSATGSPVPVTTSTSGTPGLVYFVVKTPLGERITAEQHQGVSGLTAVQNTEPVDPDYTNAVPADSLRSGRASATLITIEIRSKDFAGALNAVPDAKEAVQQVVYSANAANGTATKPLPVQFTLNGKPSTYLGQPSLAKPGKPLQTLALMSVLSPVDGATLTATKTTFSGVGSSFEATVGWKITDSTGKTVLHGSTMAAGWMDKLYPWKVNADLSTLAPGSYTFTASTDDASEGEGGGPITDTKTFTIG